MSQPRLHEVLQKTFENRNADLEVLTGHSDYLEFSKTHHLEMKSEELVPAFIHSSFSHEYGLKSQELLEFVGDSVLGLIITEELLRRFPNEKEGRLSKLRSAIVNEKSLATLARGIDLGNLILLGKGEFQKVLHEQDVVLADTFEALLAQVYRFRGLDFTRSLFLSWLERFIPEAFNENYLDNFDAKSTLQERVLAKYKKLPRYTSVDKGSEFEITVWINDEAVISGVFPSKKKGEKELAKTILEKEMI